MIIISFTLNLWDIKCNFWWAVVSKREGILYILKVATRHGNLNERQVKRERNIKTLVEIM